MSPPDHSSPGRDAVQKRLVDSLYTEAMLLADEARGYFDDVGRRDRGEMDPLRRVSFSCESLKVTTRLMHVIAWLLTQRAIAVGELTARQGLDPSRRLGAAPESEVAVLEELPMSARLLIEASVDLHRRVARLDAAQVPAVPPASPARAMMERLASAF